MYESMTIEFYNRFQERGSPSSTFHVQKLHE
ncbi:hypothetical protein NIES4106_57700 (plasmid) [Fischerella sp. NIES-4106]|nr:hypothetical protein NIES4106_57700 [Fischerella sp. NIES-4106]